MPFVSVLYNSCHNDIYKIIGIFQSEQTAIDQTLIYILDNQNRYGLLKNQYELPTNITTILDLNIYLSKNQHSDSYGGSPGWYVMIENKEII